MYVDVAVRMTWHLRSAGVSEAATCRCYRYMFATCSCDARRALTSCPPARACSDNSSSLRANIRSRRCSSHGDAASWPHPTLLQRDIFFACLSVGRDSATAAAIICLRYSRVEKGRVHTRHPPMTCYSVPLPCFAAFMVTSGMSCPFHRGTWCCGANVHWCHHTGVQTRNRGLRCRTGICYICQSLKAGHHGIPARALASAALKLKVQTINPHVHATNHHRDQTGTLTSRTEGGEECLSTTREADILYLRTPVQTWEP